MLSASHTVLLALALNNAAPEGDADASGSVSLGGGDVSADADADAKANDPNKRKDTPWIRRWAPERNMVELGIYGGVMFPHPRLELFEPDDTLPDDGFKPLATLAPEVGGRIGYYPLRFLGLEAEGSWLPTETDSGESANVWVVRGHLVAQVARWSITPFALAGASGLAVASDRDAVGNDVDLGFHFGGGLKFFFTRRFMMRLDVRDTITARRGLGLGVVHSPEVLLGFGLALNRKKAEPKPEIDLDRDDDGILDADDKCIDVPGVPEYDGSPIPDTDGDGILDPDDKCVDVPGVPEYDGCPIPDTDGDGIFDPDDKCVDEPGVPEYDGCPIPDTDGDGILDPDDKCVNEPETFNQYEDEDGCPDKVPEKVKQFTGVIEGWDQIFVEGDIDWRHVSWGGVMIDNRSYDTTGRPVYEVEVTTRDLALEGGTPLVVTGQAEVDRARYVKDAVQGVEILAFTDDSPEIEEAPPELLQGMTFDIRVETDRPFRIENNVASGLQADAVVQVTGTYEAPEFTGRLDFEPGGTVDIPFLTGTYEIQRGRGTLLRELEDAEVDVLALRNEPIYIEDQPRSVTLSLGGTLSAIRWSCITDGGGSELDTVRGCTEYLVLGAGDVQLSETDVQQFGAGGLAGVRKPLQVVGHLTEFDVGERAGEAAPRLDPYVPDVRLRLGQIGPELEIATPTEWLDFDYGRATIGWDYTRGYPGFLLRQSRETSVKLEILDPITLEYSRRSRSYLNERVIFDPLRQESIELRFDFDIPSLR